MTDPTRGDRPAAFSRNVLRLGAALGLVLAAALAGHRLGTSVTPRDAPRVPSTPRVRSAIAVLPFRNAGAGPGMDWLSVALPEALSADLTAHGMVRLIPAESVAHLSRELGGDHPDVLGPDALRRVHQNVGADVVVLGSYATDGDRLRVDIRLQSVPLGELIAMTSELGRTGEILDLVARAAISARESLQLSPSEGLEERRRAALPADPEAARAYAEGLAHLRAFDALDARDHLEQAVAAEPGFALAHAALGDAWALLGYEQRARDALKQALELAGNLSPEVGLTLEARFREARGEWSEAVRTREELFALHPDSIDHGLRLASALAGAGRGGEAIETLDALRRLPPPIPLDPRLDLVLAEAAAALGDYRASVRAARRAAERAEAQGAPLLAARAFVAESYALGLLGEISDSRRAGEAARERYARVGDRGGLAWATHRIAASFLQQGRLVEMRRVAEEARDAFAAIGYDSGLAAAENNLGYAALLQGRLADAAAHLERALAVDARTGDRRGRAHDLANLGFVRSRQGQLATALGVYDESAALAEEVADSTLAAVVSLRRARVFALQGDLDAAETGYRASIEPLKTTERQRYLANTLAGLGDVLKLRGQRDDARWRHEEARAIRATLGDRFELASSDLSLAELRAGPGETGGVALVCRSVIGTATEEQARDLEILALAALVRAERAGGNAAAALADAERLAELAAQSEDPWVRGQGLLARADLLLAAGRADAAREDAAKVAEEASRHGLEPLALRARVLLAASNTAGGDAALEVLRGEAEARGWGAFAQDIQARLQGVSDDEAQTGATPMGRIEGDDAGQEAAHGSEEEGGQEESRKEEAVA